MKFAPLYDKRPGHGPRMAPPPRSGTGGIDCPELLQKVGLKVPSFNSRFNPPFSIPHSNKNYIINSPMCRLPTSCNLLLNFDFYFDSCTKLKNSIYNLNVDG